MQDSNLNAALILIGIAFALLALVAVFWQFGRGAAWRSIEARQFWSGALACGIVATLFVGAVRDDWLNIEWCRYRSADFVALNACEQAADCELTTAQVSAFKDMKRNPGIVQCLYRVAAADDKRVAQD